MATKAKRGRIGARSGGALAACAPADRPLRPLSRAQVLERLRLALEQRDGIIGAHCVHELWMRGEMGLNVETMLSQLWTRAAVTVPDWLPMRHIEALPTVYEVASRFRREGRGRSNLYAILLDYSDSRPEPYGFYIGMTHYRPAERFDQHKAGVRAAGSVLQRGLELLPGPFMHLQRLPRGQAGQLEEQIAEALRAAGLFVQGGH